MQGMDSEERGNKGAAPGGARPQGGMHPVTDQTPLLSVRALKKHFPIRGGVLARRGLAPVYLREVATVVDGQQELENLAMINGEVPAGIRMPNQL